MAETTVINEQRVAEKGRKLLDSLPEHIRRKIEEDPGILEREIEARERSFPSKNFVPNIGQERALLSLQQKNPKTGDYPFGLVVLGGNGTGKTCDLAIVIAGVALGPEFLNHEFFANHKFFYDMKEVRSKRVIYIRIVCDGEDVTESGSVYQQIKKWIPQAEFSAKKGDYYTRIRIPPTTPDFFPVSIDVKTHKQDVVAHAGPDCDLILFNEPAPEDIFNENMGRLRRGGRWMAFLTPLHLAGYLWNIINGDNANGDIASTEISIWENCKDIPGTRGILDKTQIDRMILQWQQTDPLTVAARVEGKFTFLAGSVFSIFRRTTHVIDPEPIEKSWNVMQIVDPHPVKPHVSVWVAYDAMGYMRVIAEYPTEPWEQITTTPLTIALFAQQWRLIESGKHHKFQFGLPLNVIKRYGDPRAFMAQNPRTRMPLVAEYEQETGLEFDLNVDTDVMLRHNAIRQALFFNPQQVLSAYNTPHLFVYSTCRNMAAALERHRYLDIEKQGKGEGMSDKVDNIWDCFVAALGYGLVAKEPWRDVSNRRHSQEGDYEKYLRGMQGVYSGKEGKPMDESVLCRY